MPDDILVWPRALLRPNQVLPSPVPMSRSGGPTLGGLDRPTRTDTGFWSIAYKGIALSTPDRRRWWNAIRTRLAGRAGLVAVPVWSYDIVAWPDGSVGGRTRTRHSDGSPFSDGSRYTQPTIVVELVEAVEIGTRELTLRLVTGITELTGARFSYQHALYEIGLPSAIADDEWTVEIFPAIRAAIPADAQLEFDLPTCLCHLATDRAMDGSFTAGKFDKVDVAFLEATDYWNDLAVA